MNKILNFHVVSDASWFEKMVLFLKSKYRMVSIETLYEYSGGKLEVKNLCHITVDDGDLSFYDNIFPVLKKHKVPASLFVSPKICEQEINFWYQEIIGYDNILLKKVIGDLFNTSPDKIANYSVENILKSLRFSYIQEIIKNYQEVTRIQKKPFQNMTVNNLREVRHTGLVTVGAHTVNHPILRNETDENSRFEISASIKDLSRLLNEEIRYFAYPNGIPNIDFTEREMECLKTSGIHLAFSTEAKNFTRNDDLMAVPRIAVTDNENINFFKLKLLAGSSWVNIKQLKPTNEKRERNKLTQIFAPKIELAHRGNLS